MARASGRTEAGSRSGQTRVLVADDSRVVRTMVCAGLRRAGYHVAEAENGSVALRRLEKDPFDVVISNLNLPVLGGLGLLEAVQRRQLGVEVIILTGSDEMESAIHALRLGAHDYLLKPPDRLDEICLTVERAAEKKRLRDENTRLLRELEALSRTDFLTGLPNRRSLEEALGRELQLFRRHGQPLTVAMIDVDHFKVVNDAHGHPIGDEVLRWFARFANAAFRGGDALYRCGGEEFTALLSATSLEGGLEASRRLIEQVAVTPFQSGLVTLRLTCSVGLAEARPGDASAAAHLLARADRALYRAKAKGRNRVEVDGSAAPGQARPTLSGAVS